MSRGKKLFSAHLGKTGKFLDIKARREEGWLQEKLPGYGAIKDVCGK